ncbi:MAG: hypothetical protein J6W46_02490 [Spirochaetaceae bacterium]|nr:hypothetical protein [Spirochaetaceae bacterium]MBP5792497.1 hypothetical protein [Spirochaetaceae bacterium]
MLEKNNSFSRTGKLLKYELLCSSQVLLPIYGILLLVSVIAYFEQGISGSFNTGIMNNIESVLVLVYTGVFIAASVLTVMHLISRFKKTMFSDEAYLTMSLPVTVNNHLVSKLVSALLWGTLCITVASLSFFLLFVRYMDAAEFMDILFNVFPSIMEELEITSMPGFLFALFICYITALVEFVLWIYCIMSVGHLFKNHRRIAQVLAAVVIMVVSNNVTQVIFKHLISNLDRWNGSVESAFYTLVGIFVLCNIVFSAVYFAVSSFILSRKLNLE